MFLDNLERCLDAECSKEAVPSYRRRMKQRGMVRLEVRVRKGDVTLIRDVVNALADPRREREARAVLRERFGARRVAGLKALLAAAPIDGIDLKRAQDTGRAVDF